jgi:uncharacterized membrane protein YgcG
VRAGVVGSGDVRVLRRAEPVGLSGDMQLPPPRIGSSYAEHAAPSSLVCFALESAMRFVSFASLAAALSLASLALVGCGAAPDATQGDAIGSGEEALTSADCFGTGDPKACLCQHRIGHYGKACEPGQFCSPNFGCMAQSTAGVNCVVRPIAASDPSCGAGLQCCPNAALNAASNGGFDGTCRSSCGVRSGLPPISGGVVTAPMKGTQPASGSATGGSSSSSSGSSVGSSTGGSSSGSSSGGEYGSYQPRSADRGEFCRQNLDCKSGLGCLPLVGRCAEICQTVGCYVNRSYQCVRQEVSTSFSGVSTREVACR